MGHLLLTFLFLRTLLFSLRFITHLEIGISEILWFKIKRADNFTALLSLTQNKLRLFAFNRQLFQNPTRAAEFFRYEKHVTNVN